MIDQEGTSTGPSRVPPALWIVGGLLVVISLVLPWYVYSANGTPDSLTGVGLFQYLPELGVLAAGGLALVLLGVALGRSRVWGTALSRDPSAKLAALITAIGAYTIPVEVAFRFGATSRGIGGTTFIYAVGPGWGLALVGVTLALLGAIALWIRPPATVGKGSESVANAPTVV